MEDERIEQQIQNSPMAIKSNVLIGAKYKSSLLENQILTYAIANINDAVMEDGGLRFTFNASELRSILGKDNSGSFYNKLQPIAAAMTGRTIGISDPVQKKFRYHAIVTDAVYNNGEFSIYFNKKLADSLLLDLRSNFTKLSLKVMLSFKSVYSFRLYELLKSRAYTPKGVEDITYFEIPFGLSELQLLLGVVNAELDAVKSVLNDSSHPDYDKAVEKSPEKVATDWSNFKRRVIEKGINEINSMPETGMNVSYSVVRSGKGGKISKVIFNVKTQNYVVSQPIRSQIELSEDEKNDMISQLMMDLNDINIKIHFKDARAVLEAAEYNAISLKRAVLIMEGSTTPVEDPIAFLINALKKEHVLSRSQMEKLREKGYFSYSGANVDSKDQSNTGLDMDPFGEYVQIGLPFEVHAEVFSEILDEDGEEEE